MNRIVLSLMLFAGSLFISLQAHAVTQVQASVDRNPAVVGEYFVLTVTADDDLSAGAFDPSILLDNFIVNRTSVGRSTKMINFKTSKETRWQVILSPKQSGQVTIPAFTINGVSSQPIELTVASPGTQTDEVQDLFIRASASVDSAYVGQLITYKVKLYLAAELQRGAINSPQVEGAQVKQIGEDADGTEIINGRRFRVIERTYGIIADLPGPLEIKGASFNGDILVEAPRRGGMFGFNESKPMRSQADDMQIDIKSAPASYQGEWLVADIAVLQEEWPTDGDFSVGSPITRTITLTVTGSDDSSIPDIDMPLPSGLKAYPEKPVRHSFVRQGQVVSQYSIATAIVPTKAGEFTLPEVVVPWWNPQTHKQEYARLPAKVVTIKAGDTSAPLTPITNVQTEQVSAGYWPWVSATFALMWLISTALWLNARKQQPSATPPKLDNEQHSQADLLALTKACKQQNASQILRALQQYFSAMQDKPVTLNQISALSPELKAAIEQLQAAKYSATPQGIDTQKLINAVKGYKSSERRITASAVAPLNP
nr:BatD family protein [Shewanella maritima]